MAASLTSILTGSWLTGPILGKELRMASRRRRHYVVRFLYLMVLVLMISLFWMQVGNYHTSAVSYLNQMSEIGRVMTLMIEWFQFVLCPIIAGVMLSTAISDEVYHKTLGVLMTTPHHQFAGGDGQAPGQAASNAAVDGHESTPIGGDSRFWWHSLDVLDQ